MLLRVDVIDRAIKHAAARKSKKRRIILLSPEGKRFDQSDAQRLQKFDELVLICGHYEGFDRRIDMLVDEKISIGDYVLSGGETAALNLIDCISRLEKNVLGKEESKNVESFSKVNDKLILEHPQYTRPEVYKNMNVPEVLLSGHHENIKKWQLQNQTEL